MRVVILGTYRDSELSRSHPFLETLAALHRQRGVAHVELRGLDDNGVLALMESSAGHALEGAAVQLAHAVHRETDGNPFFVSEVLRHLSETGKIYQDADGRWVADDSLGQMALPDSVRVVIGARVGRLGPDAERVLSLAAVIGRDFDLHLLARSANTSEDELLDILDAAAAAALVRELADTPGRYNFAHALIQHTLYEDLGPTRRARAHRQVAESLEELCGDRPGARVGELARHWFSATQPIDLDKAIAYSRQAGDAALAALAPGDALRYYAQALDLSTQAGATDPLIAIDVRIGLGIAQRQTGDAAFRETLLDAARRAADLGDTDRLVAAALANDRGWNTAFARVDDEKVEALEAAAARLPADHPDRALVLAMLCQELTYGGTPLERRQTLADEAIGIARSSGDDATIIRVLNAVMHPLGVPQLLEQSLRWSDEALLRAERLGDPALLFWAVAYRSCYVPIVGDVAELERCTTAARALAEQLDQPILRWASTFLTAGAAQLAGDLDRADELAARALQIGTDCGQPDATMIYGAQAVTTAMQRGDVTEWIPIYESFVTEFETQPGIAASVAMQYLMVGRVDEARAILASLAAVDFDIPLELGWLGSQVGFAMLVAELGDIPGAEVLLERLRPFADLLPYIINSVAPVAKHLGDLATVLGRYDEADDFYRRAAAFSEKAGMKSFVADTDLAWGTMLRQRNAPGDADEARELLTKAHTVAAANGYGRIERLAAEALQPLG